MSNSVGHLDSLDSGKRVKQPARMNSLNRYADPVYCLMRLIVGLMFACHGADKIFGMFGGKIATAPLMQFGGWIELGCGVLIAVGLLTRIAAFLASGMMAVAFFMAHFPGGFFPIVNKGELAVVYCFVFLFMIFYGAGRWSIDALFSRSQSAPDR
jgi:putative oxidoreductase